MNTIPTQQDLQLTYIDPNRAVASPTPDGVRLIETEGDRPPIDSGEIVVDEARVIYLANLVQYKSRWVRADQLQAFKKFYSRDGASVSRIELRTATYQVWLFSKGHIDWLERTLVSEVRK